MQSKQYEHRRLRMISEQAEGEILDLGHAALPNPFLPGDRTVGLDISEPVRPTGYRADEIGSVYNLDQLLGNRRFDTVIAGELIEHLDAPYAFLEQVRAVLRPSGRLVLSTPSPLGFPTLLFEILGSRRFFYADDHLYYFPMRWVWRMLEKSGFVVERTLPVGMWLPFGFIPSPRWLSYQIIYVASIAHPARPANR